MTTEQRKTNPHRWEDVSLDHLWQEREWTDEELRRLRNRKTQIEQELASRFVEAHPGFNVDSGGTVEIAGDSIVIKLGYSRDYAVSQDAVMDLLASKLLTDAEFESMVSYEPKVNGTKLNTFMRRGGDLATYLGRLRYLKSSRPEFEAKARQ